MLGQHTLNMLPLQADSTGHRVIRHQGVGSALLETAAQREAHLRISRYATG